MKKIIHLSDIHVGFSDLGAKFFELTTRLTALKQPASNYIIIITGDIVDNAFNEANIFESFSVTKKLKESGYDVLVVPGNHDCGTGAWGAYDCLKKFQKTYYSGIQKFPIVNIIEEVAFIGLNSMEKELHWYDRIFADGELGKHQLQRLNKKLNLPEVTACKKRVVYLHHHPFDPKGGIFHCLKDSDKLKDVVSGKIDALLYGHNHDGKISNGQWNIPRCYDAGSATHKNGDNGYHRVIDLEKDPRWDYDGDFL